MVKKTRMMRLFERLYGEPLEVVIPRLYEEKRSLAGVAQELGIHRSTLSVWLKRLELHKVLVKEK